MSPAVANANGPRPMGQAHLDPMRIADHLGGEKMVGSLQFKDPATFKSVFIALRPSGMNGQHGAAKPLSHREFLTKRVRKQGAAKRQNKENLKQARCPCGHRSHFHEHAVIYA